VLKSTGDITVKVERTPRLIKRFQLMVFWGRERIRMHGARHKLERAGEGEKTGRVK